MQPRRVRSEKFIERIREISPDVLALAAFGQIVPQALLDIPPLGPINVHGSLLPKYRGAAPIQRAIMAGETETGVTTMWMDATLDTGDMLMSEMVPIEPEDNAGTMFPKLADVGARLLVETLDGLAAGTLARRKQDDSQATLAPAIQPEDAEIDWSESATQIHNRIRGVTPKPGAFTSIRAKRIKIWSSEITDPGETLPEPGAIVRINKKPQGLVVACGTNSALLILEAQPESSKKMNAADLARGLRLAAGDTFIQRESPHPADI
jgi:methionyl-tRNA formyltransferase